MAFVPFGPKWGAAIEETQSFLNVPNRADSATDFLIDIG